MKGKTIGLVVLGLFIVLIIKDPNAASKIAMGVWGALNQVMAFFANLIA